LVAQQEEDIKQQLEQLKQEYQKKIEDLEQRIAGLEKQRSQTSVPPEPAPQQSKSQGVTSALGNGITQGVKTAIVGQGSQVPSVQGQLPSAPTYDCLQEAQTEISKLQAEAKTCEFHGYFRSGYGLNSVDGQQIAFQAPGADTKFPLGQRSRDLRRIDFCEQLDQSRTRTEPALRRNSWLRPTPTIPQPTRTQTRISSAFGKPLCRLGTFSKANRMQYFGPGSATIGGNNRHRRLLPSRHEWLWGRH
jgi:hypothetical protein